MKRRWIVLMAAGGAALGWLFFLRGLPNPARQNPRQIVALLASDDFARHSDADRKAYLDRLKQVQNWQAMVYSQRSQLDVRQLDNLDKAIGLREETAAQFIDEYFLLPEDQRTACLDRFIDKMIREPRAAAASRPTTGPAPRPLDAKSRAERMARAIEVSDPVDRAKTTVFRQAVLKRVAEQGGL